MLLEVGIYRLMPPSFARASGKLRRLGRSSRLHDSSRPFPLVSANLFRQWMTGENPQVGDGNDDSLSSPAA